MGVMLSATNSLNWLSSITGKSASDLTADLGDTLRPPNRTQFLPYLSGERTPHNDAAIRGSFTGLGIDTSITDLTQAVLEGVAFGFRDCLEAFHETGTTIDRLMVIGGGTRSAYWLKLLATVLGVPLERPKDGEFGAALGAARLARIAHTGEAPANVMAPPEIAAEVTPDPELSDQFDASHKAFKAAYGKIRSAQYVPLEV